MENISPCLSEDTVETKIRPQKAKSEGSLASPGGSLAGKTFSHYLMVLVGLTDWVEVLDICSDTNQGAEEM